MLEDYTRAYEALQNKKFFKLVCGASFHDLNMIENLVVLFSVAGADMIDLSASPEVILTAQKAIDFSKKEYELSSTPIIMASINLDNDPHFRKVEVDYSACDLCSACIKVCPTDAFSIKENKFIYKSERCYGCGDCPSVCHVDALSLNEFTPSPKESLEEILKLGVSAVEIHFGKNYKIIEDRWSEIGGILKQFKFISFSIGGQGMTAFELKEAAKLCHKLAGENIVIQCDGQSMSGGSVRKGDKDSAAIGVANEIMSLKLPVYVQLSGGTDENTMSKSISKNVCVNGVAIGSYARKKLLMNLTMSDLLTKPLEFAEGLAIAKRVVDSVKNNPLPKPLVSVKEVV